MIIGCVGSKSRHLKIHSSKQKHFLPLQCEDWQQPVLCFCATAQSFQLCDFCVFVLERRRSRSTSRERERRRRERSRSRDRDRRRSRSRSPHRRRSRSPRRHRSTSPSPSRLKERRDEEKKETKETKSKERQITEEDLEGKTEEEIEMMKLMGFASFDSTKGKKVDGSVNAYAINVSQKRKYRQYMNRKGGFNRPLDFIAWELKNWRLIFFSSWSESGFYTCI